MVRRKSTGEFRPEVIELLKTFATQSVLAIQNARLFREIEEKSQQIEAANRHKSEFLANMSHELRTPLNSLLILSDQLCKNPDGNLTAKQVEFARTIHGAGTDLLNLITDILDLSKIESGTVVVDPTDLQLEDLRRKVDLPAEAACFSVWASTVAGVDVPAEELMAMAVEPLVSSRRESCRRALISSRSKSARSRKRWSRPSARSSRTAGGW